MYLTQGLHRAVQQDPDRPMTIYGDRVRTARESRDRISRLAAGLRSLGVKPGDRVGIFSMNSDRYHEYLLAVPWLGAVVTPVNIRWSPAEVAYSLQESDTRVLLVDDDFFGALPAIRSVSNQMRREVLGWAWLVSGDRASGSLMVAFSGSRGGRGRRVNRSGCLA
ncbi:hypothetical protein DQ226_15125 [Dietzia maris]|uniref:AMP-dependent synthetase/ligase domain-containing protein n=1 Tax=Dietzia maris TaxID=37915 RepID=A0A365P786_9ACTN|nr:hypothetical protein DQ226_15125 [Dietzia maris]